MSPELILGLLIALAIYLAGAVCARSLANWLYDKEALQYAALRRERNWAIALWPITGLVLLAGVAFYYVLSILFGHSRRSTSERHP